MSYSVKRSRCKQFFRVMRITTLLLFVFIFCMHAENSSSQNVNVTIKRSNTELENVLNDIEKQTDYLFIYNKFVNVDRKVSVNLKKASLEEVLANLFAGTDVKYSVDGSYILLSAGGTTTTIPLSAQQGKTVSGVITDINGEPIIGANVVEKGSESVGTVTDVDGKFTLALDKPTATLVVSYIGYLTKEVPVGSQSVLKIILSEDTQNLEEVVVIGYGSVKKSDLTGAVGSIQVDKVQGISVKSVDQMLQGRTSGLYMVQNSGMPGASSTVRIRGGNSISGGNEPLYIIDGMPVYPSADASQTALSPLNSIPTSDIESIEVLKDASSTAIYGSRGANGVIIVTTKKGKSGKTSVAFDAYWGIQNIYKKYDLLDSRSFERLANEALVNSGGAAIYDESLTPATTDWQDLTSNKNALTQNYQLTVSGGNDKTTFLTSFNYFDQEGVIKASEMKKYAFRANIDHKISSTINLGLSLTMTKVDNNRVGNSVLQSRLTTPPNLPVMQDDGSYTFSDNNGVITFDNPVGVINEKVDWHTSFRSLNNAFVEWNIIKGLKFKSSFGIDIDYATNKSYNPRSVYSGSQKSGEAKKVSNNTYTWINENILTYTNTWGVHSFTGMVGYTQQQSTYDGFNAGSYGFLNDNLQMNNLGSGTTYTAPGSEVKKWALNSYLARVNYTVNNKYLLTASIRADGSSRFGSDNRWGYFPAASAGWVVSEEKFWNVRNFNSFKIRASYGLTGNNYIGLYDAYGGFGATSIYNGASAILPTALPNMRLKWETTHQLDIGVDMGFFNDRIRLMADYYNKKTTDLLFSVTLPDTSGYGSARQNVGSVRFYGAEVELSTVNIQSKNFTWTTDFTYSFNMNKVLSLPDEYRYKDVDGKDAWRIGGYTMSETGFRFGGTAVGERMGRIYGYKTAYIIETEAQADAALYDVNSHGIRRSDGRSIAGRKDIGDYEWLNRAGSARTADGSEQINDEDMFLLGYVTPHSTGGMNNTFKYRNLSLSVYVDYALGHSVYNYMYTRGLQTSMGNCNWNLIYDANDCWQKPGDNTKLARLSANDADGGNKNYSRISDISVQKGDYLCLRDVTLSYSFPKRWIGKLGLGNLTVSVSGNTLVYWTKVKGVSPESAVAASGSSTGMYSVVNTSSADYSIYPPTRKVMFSLKATF